MDVASRLASTDWRTWLNLATGVFGVWFLLVLAQDSGVAAVYAAFETVHAVVGVVPVVEPSTIDRVLGQLLRGGLLATVVLFLVSLFSLTKTTNEDDADV